MGFAAAGLSDQELDRSTPWHPVPSVCRQFWPTGPCSFHGHDEPRPSICIHNCSTACSRARAAPLRPDGPLTSPGSRAASLGAAPPAFVVDRPVPHARRRTRNSNGSPYLRSNVWIEPPPPLLQSRRLHITARDASAGLGRVPSWCDGVPRLPLFRLGCIRPVAPNRAPPHPEVSAGRCLHRSQV